MKDWLRTIKKKLNEQVEQNISARDYRFYQVGKLMRIAFRLQLYAEKNCLDCKHMKQEIENLIEKLSEMINGSGAMRKMYEDTVENMISHLRKTHQVYPAFYFAYRYSFFYMLLGILLGLTVSFGFFGGFNWEVALLCWGGSLVLGNIVGARKDRKVRRQGKLL